MCCPFLGTHARISCGCCCGKVLGHRPGPSPDPLLKRPLRHAAAIQCTTLNHTVVTFRMAAAVLYKTPTTTHSSTLSRTSPNPHRTVPPRTRHSCLHLLPASLLEFTPKRWLQSERPLPELSKPGFRSTWSRAPIWGRIP